MDSSSSNGFDDSIRFYVGHHDAKRMVSADGSDLRHAQDQNYDMLTAPITTDAFQSKVLDILSTYLGVIEEAETPLHSIAGQANVPAAPILPSLTPADTALGPNESIGQLIVTTSTWIDLTSPDPLIADISRQTLVLEISYASFCGATNVMIKGPPAHTKSEDGLIRYAHAIQEALSAATYLQLHLTLPMTGESLSELEPDMGDLETFARDEYVDDLGVDDDDEEEEDEADEIDEMASWDAWNVVRSLCRYNARLSIALAIPKNLPSPAIQSRWFSEPLRVLNIPRESFSGSGTAVNLLQPQRELIWQYMRLRPTPWILLSNTGSLIESHSSFSAADFPDLKQASDKTQTSSSQSTTSHWHYLNHIRHFQHNQPARPLVELFGAGYQDYLQNPLQPLADNLESITYEVFEKDPIKYEWYERAVTAALQDWTTSKKTGSGPNGRIVCAVTGAGRGPLVTRALEASKKTGIEIDMWAVEKNPNAYVLLQRHNATTWQNRVSLVQSDMRTWSGPQDKSSPSATPYKIDILISELLGSLADNELSPECIDGVQHLLNPTHGISIPSSYTAHISPIAAPKIHADILARSAAGDTEAFSVPYVTMLHAIDFLSARPPLAQPRAGLELVGVRSGCGGGMPDIPLQPVIREAWEFVHPIPTSNLLPPAERNPTASGNEHNTRATRLEFACRHRGVCHGLAGYFETVLYDPVSVLGVDDTLSSSSPGKPKVELSTNPLTMDRKSRDMISWFPMFLPLRQPLYFPDECILVVHMWRRTEGRSVWYEWCVESFKVERNKGGKARRVRVGGSEVVSSKASACLM